MLFLIPKWVLLSIKDLIKFIKHPVRRKEYGVWVYVGLYGEGKTLSMVREAYTLYKKSGYKIYSNFGVSFQTGEIKGWEDLLEVPPYSVILLDELPNLLDNYAFREMPSNLFALLSQNRKLHIRIMATAQVFDDSVKKFRTLTRYVIICKKAGRLIQNRFYNQKQFGRGDSVKKAEFRRYFLAEDFLFEFYNTFEFIKKLKAQSENRKSELSSLAPRETNLTSDL